jgi:hypothetical protein
MTVTRHTTTTTPIDPVDVVAELTRHHHHIEAYSPDHHDTPTTHATRVPSLLEQLAHAGPSTTTDRPANGYPSRPAATLEALDALHAIDRDARTWLRHLRAPTLGDTPDLVRRLGSLLPRIEDPRTAEAVTRDLRAWHAQARVMTGWSTHPWRPENTCPLCGERRTLRVRWDQQLAHCTHCRETWDADTIGLLADHVRAENEAEQPPPTDDTPCHCPIPRPTLDRLNLCPACGSSRCVKALTATAPDPKDQPRDTPTA